MIIEVCSQNRALKEVTNIQTGELVSVISIVSSDEKDVKFDCKENLCGVLHLKFNDLEKEYDEEGIPYGRPLPKSKDLNGLKDSRRVRNMEIQGRFGHYFDTPEICPQQAGVYTCLQRARNYAGISSRSDYPVITRFHASLRSPMSYRPFSK